MTSVVASNVAIEAGNDYILDASRDISVAGSNDVSLAAGKSSPTYHDVQRGRQDAVPRGLATERQAHHHEAVPHNDHLVQLGDLGEGGSGRRGCSVVVGAASFPVECPWALCHMAYAA